MNRSDYLIKSAGLTIYHRVLTLGVDYDSHPHYLAVMKVESYGGSCLVPICLGLLSICHVPFKNNGNIPIPRDKRNDRYLGGHVDLSKRFLGQ